MLVVSDVHGAFSALSRLAAEEDTLLILGDLVNLVDYRTNEGIIPDVIGADVVADVVRLRAEGDYEGATAAWLERTQALGIDVRGAIGQQMVAEYEDMRAALSGVHGYATYGNVDDPAVLEAHLPPTMTFVDAETIDIDGLTFGFAGGGVPRIGSRGEVTNDEMATKLSSIGPVDVLCTHVPPAIDMLAQDVVASPAKGSEPVLAYIDECRPRYHLFGDVHQPRASRYVRGSTICINVGYFRATGRPFVFQP